MLKNTRRSLLAGGALILTGLVLFAVVMTVNGWDFEKLSTVDYETSTYKITEEFKNIRVNTYESDVLLLPSGDDECRIVIREDKKLKHAFSVTEDTLTIEPAGKRKWYDHIAVIPDSGRITLYLPETEYAYLNIRTDTGDIVVPADFRFSRTELSGTTGDITLRAPSSGDIILRATTGDILLENISSGAAIDLTVSTGDITVQNIKGESNITLKISTGKTRLTDISCKGLQSKGTTGDITLSNVIAYENLSVQRTTGDVDFKKCDAPLISIRTGTGDINGTLLTEKTFTAEVSTGKIEIPESRGSETCELTATTGSIFVRIEN